MLVQVAVAEMCHHQVHRHRLYAFENHKEIMATQVQTMTKNSIISTIMIHIQILACVAVIEPPNHVAYQHLVSKQNDSNFLHRCSQCNLT